MTNSEKLLALYDEIIVNRYIDEKDVMKEWYEKYKTFLESVQVRTVALKNGKKLDYDNGDQEFLDLFFISSNPVSSRGSNPISDEDLRAILRSNEFTGLIEETMLNPNKKSWDALIEKGKSIFKRSHYDNQPLRFNRISASCTSNLIPMPSESAFNKFIKYLTENKIIDFKNIDKNWYAQNEYLTSEIHKTFTNRMLDENDFTDEYWLNLFAWSLYDKKVNQKQNDVEIVVNKSDSGNFKLKYSLNLILFGAAGTGKTFHTINHALSIIENKPLEVLEQEGRTALKARFDKYKEEDQIKFVTFHQSFSYEDFVEGIRAETDDNGQLNYDVKDGVFKEICSLAKGQYPQNDRFLDAPIEFGRGYKLLQVTADMLELEKPNGNIFHLSKKLADFLLDAYRNKQITLKNLSDKEVIDVLGNHSILEPYLVNGYNTVWANLIPLLDENPKQSEHKDSGDLPYVLIIDEINRGNISRIFGELITLIEDSKRQGAEDELSVTLPYSKEEFSVPNNVHIIGTMNSSDRSLTGLDIALRRRFTFIEMPPKPELLSDIEVEGLNIAELLKVINQRIEVLLDRDHCIGHANFMSLNKDRTREHLAAIFKQKIIPQLQEYFFDDWSKINMVLNANGMLKANPVERSALFPNVESDSDGFLEEQKIWQLNDTAFDSIASFSKIIKH